MNDGTRLASLVLLHIVCFLHKVRMGPMQAISVDKALELMEAAVRAGQSEEVS